MSGSARLPTLLVALLLAAPVTGQDQDSGSWIEITEPAEWRGEATRGIAVPSGDAIRVEGRARHPNGIDRILINGLRATLSPGSAGVTRFVGYVNVDPSVVDVEIAAYPRGGRVMLRKFDVRPLQAAASPAAARDAPAEGFSGERWAVIVGISEYADPSIPGLKYADDDARAMYDFLTSEAAGLGGFDPDRILLLLNEDATFLRMREALFDFLKSPTEDDIVLVYFAGHGAPDRERPGEYYLLPHDARAGAIAGSAFPMADVTSAIRRTYARDMIVITDACHSAGVGGQAGLREMGLNQINRAFLEQLEATSGGIAIFTASESNQYSQEGEQWGGGHGVFTWKIMEALGGAADQNGDRIVNLGEMMEYVRAQVARETRNSQIPTISQTAFDRSWPMSVVTEPRPARAAGVAEEASSVPEPTRPAPEVAALELDRTELELVPGQEQALTVEGRTATGAAIDPGRVAWRSSDTNGLTVDRSGRVRARTIGRYTVTAAGAGHDATASVYVLPRTYSVGGVLAHSLLIPGSGQFRTGHTGRGLVTLAAVAGAAAAGLLVKEVEVDCAGPPSGGACPESDILDRRVDRPYLIYGLGAAAAVTLWGAVDAALSAGTANSRAAELRQQWGRLSTASVRFGPVMIGGRAGVGVRVALPLERGR